MILFIKIVYLLIYNHSSSKDFVDFKPKNTILCFLLFDVWPMTYLTNLPYKYRLSTHILSYFLFQNLILGLLNKIYSFFEFHILKLVCYCKISNISLSASIHPEYL